MPRDPIVGFHGHRQRPKDDTGVRQFSICSRASVTPKSSATKDMLPDSSATSCRIRGVNHFPLTSGADAVDPAHPEHVPLPPDRPPPDMSRSLAKESFSGRKNAGTFWRRSGFRRREECVHFPCALNPTNRVLNQCVARAAHDSLIRLWTIMSALFAARTRSVMSETNFPMCRDFFARWLDR
jgi:hypothetical protein